jgi:hypothetical protein
MRRIARQLHPAPRTVKKYLVTPVPLPGHRHRSSKLDLFKALITELLERDPYAPGVVVLQRLRAAGSNLSSPLAWRSLETVRCVEVDWGAQRKLCVTRGSQHAAQVLKALAITHLDPPQAPRGEETLMY